MKKKYTSIRLEITSKCNLNCSYCHNSKYANSKDDLSYEQIKNLINCVINDNDIKKILLTGGEPLINPNVVDLVRFITSKGIKCDMVTNGILLTKEKMLELDKAGLKRIRLSIDDISTKNHNRDNINSQIILNKIHDIVDNTSIEVCIHTVVTPDNVDNLFELYQTVINSGAKRWRVFDIGYQGALVENDKKYDLTSYYRKLIISSKKIIKDYLKNNYEKIVDIEINNIFKTSFLFMNVNDYKIFDFNKEYEKKMNLSPCNYVTNHQMTFRSNGEATLCQYFRNPIYKYENYELVELDDQPVENVIKLKNIDYCKNCKYVLNCNSGCRSRALYFTNDINSPDPIACVLHDLVYKEIIPILPENVRKIYGLYINKNGNKPKFTFYTLNKLLEENGFIKNE